jgi:zinc protease
MLSAFKTDFKIAQAEAFDPTPANIEGRLVRAKLTNGMKLALLPKQTANGRITATVELRFGDAASLAGKHAAAQFAGSLLMAGTKSKTRQQIQDEMQKLNAQITVSGGGGAGAGGGRGGRGGGGAATGIATASASVSAPAENFEAAMRLAAELLKEPAFPQDEFERMKSQRQRSLAEPPTEPEQLSSEALSRHLSPFAKTDALYTQTREEQLDGIDKVTLDDAKQFYSRFYGANNGVVAVVGLFDRAAVQKLAEELFGKWNSPAPFQRLVTPFKATPAINQKIETPDKANAQLVAGTRLQLGDGDPDYPALVLGNYMLGGSITARIPNRIRNNEGLSYTVNTSLSVPSEGDAALFSGLAIANPANVPKAEASFKDEIAKTLREGFTAEETAIAKKAFADSRMVSRSQDSALLQQIASHELIGRSFRWDGDIESKVQALTPAQINAALKKHLDPATISIVKAGDFRGAGVYR